MKKIFTTFALIALFFVANISLSAKVITISVDGAISAGSSAYIINSIKYAELQNANALIIQLNTPGGFLESTRKIVNKIMSSKVPIVVYVSPKGSRAGSAGVFITLAAHISAMSPSTNIGAAHPVSMSDDKPDSIMNAKITNDAAAFIRSIANQRNKNIDWAERTVRESISATEEEALLAGAIDFISPNIETLVKQIDGIVVRTAMGEFPLHTAGVEIFEKEMSWGEEFLIWISNPNIAYILLMIGIYGIIFEVWSPGTLFPGVIGSVSLLFGLYSMQMFPVNYIGILFIALALVLFILEIKIVSYGLLTITGIISLTIGSMMLVDTPHKYMDISMNLIIGIVILTALFFALLVAFGLKAQKLKKLSGNSAMLNSKGNALSLIKPGAKGQVRIFGEIWSAESEENIEKGDEIIVVEIQDFVLKVRRTAK